ncbi:MAG: mannitol-1-phosphate 5-dehydrogenase [Spirochaetaceae bacterium]|jgi:mannitol-1-phosphate 5-dehydrogenase|nr:mannitol-1-phosphate 5-dehydrogenase [Spirochaetaceae bacterium]
MGKVHTGPKLVQFGAGNIGRSFIGQIFSRSGWEVVFVDVDRRLVSLLNERRCYTVVIKREGKPGEFRRVGPVRAVDGGDPAAVAAELAAADMAATSVGKSALPKILPLIAKGLAERRRLSGDRPLDIIIAENDREAPGLFRSVLQSELGPDYPLDALVGLVETSIGKMVPIMKAADTAADPLMLFAEEYETLILDKRGFRGLPFAGLRDEGAAGPGLSVSAIHPVDPIAAYVDRKLFVHNLGHAAAAYLGFQGTSGAAVTTIPEALALPGVEAGARRAMNEAADALVLEYPGKRYPGSYSREDLAAHIEDLLFRFKNRALGDTVYRVGRDLGRKLGREDRLTGAMLLCAKYGLPFGGIAEVYRAALSFAVPAEDGALFPADREFRRRYGLEETASAEKALPVLREVSLLDNSRSADRAVMNTVLQGRF